MEKKIIYLILFLLAIPLALSQMPSLGTFEAGECMSLIQTCSNCTYVNITSVFNPNGEVIIGESSMTKSGNSYNYTFCDTDLIGKYIYWAVGNPDGEESNPSSVTFEITKTGQEFKDSFTIPVILPTILMLIVSAFSLFLAFKINLPSVKTLLIIFSGVILLFAVMYNLNVVNDVLSGFESITGGYVLFYKLITILTWVVFLILTVYSLFMAVNYLKSRKGLK